MIPIVDYHIHTPMCGHADGEPGEYAAHAIKIGLQEIGFSDHAPLVSHRDPGITMDFDELPQYCALIDGVKKTYPGLSVKLGIEADFIPGYEDKTKDMLSQYPFDYVIGSVHFIGKWGFDNPTEREHWKQSDIDQVYRQYYVLLRQSAESGLFDVMAHVDLVKKFGHRPRTDLQDAVRKTAEVFKRTGVTIEINSSGLRKPVGEIYPSLENLKIYREFGVPITFGSDSHVPTDVGRDFDKAVALAQAAGYKEYVIFEKRTVEKTLKLK